MSQIEQARLAAFRLPPEAWGSVYLHFPDPRLADALAEKRRALGKRLPLWSLKVALRVLTGGFFEVFDKPINASSRGMDADFLRGQYPLLISREPLEGRFLQHGIRAWEIGEDLDQVGPPLHEFPLVELLHPCPVAVFDQLYDQEGLRRKPPLWVWQVGAWNAVEAMSARPLQLERGPISLRLDTEGTLLTWDHPVVARRGRREGRAMHQIRPQMATLPGYTDPLLLLQANVVRLADTWKKAGKAWVARDPEAPLIGELGHFWDRQSRVTRWQRDSILEAVRWADLPTAKIPYPKDTDLRESHTVRAKHYRNPVGFPVGAGTGPHFGDRVAHHLREVIPGAEPLSARRKQGRLARPPRREPATIREWVAQRLTARGDPLWLVGLYETPAMRQRMRAQLRHMLDLPDTALEQDNRVAEGSGVTVALHGVEGGLLTDPALTADQRRTRLASLRDQLGGEEGRIAAWVETLGAEAREALSPVEDPKVHIRQLLAEVGIVSQFLAPDSAPENAGSSQEEVAESPGGRPESVLIGRSRLFRAG